jgi:hypothetical protein
MIGSSPERLINLKQQQKSFFPAANFRYGLARYMIFFCIFLHYLICSIKKNFGRADIGSMTFFDIFLNKYNKL